MSNDHPDPKTVAAAIELLKTIPTTWTPVSQLSHASEAALGLLVAGGLVERRVRLRLRATGKSEAVECTLQFHGQAGLAQATEPAAAEAWALWGLNQAAKPQVYVEWPDGAGEWRLTDQGTTAQDEANRGETIYLRDFLRTPGLPGVEGIRGPLRFVPGVWRRVVSGEGRVVSVQVVGTTPLSVHVENLSEVSGALRDVAKAMERRLMQPSDATPNDLCTTSVALRDYCTSRTTIRRHIADGTLRDYRPPTAAKNAALLLSRAELERIFIRK